MTIKLNNQVNLHIIPTNKYKTVRIVVRFATPLDAITSSKRSLLASLMETNSLNFPDQVALSKKLAELYGAGFYVSVNRTGNQHYLSIGLNVINDNIAPNGVSILEDSVEFLKEIIFNPNIKNNAFDTETFAREKENLIVDIESIFDDKQTYAAMSLQNLFFSDNKNQKTPSFGDINQIKQETPESIAEYYTHMIAHDKIDILVSGNVEEGYVERCFKNFGFVDREEMETDLFYKQPFKNIIQQKSEVLPVVQSKLNIGYHCDVYYHDDMYFPLMVFNGLFGGFPHSKLFLNVREKHSLAYYASSSIDPFRGFISVQTGIDSSNRERVLRLVNEQLKNMTAGEFSDELLEQTKKMLINQYLLSSDNQRSVVEQYYLFSNIPYADLPQEEWMSKMNAVTKEDVQDVATGINLQAVYFMEGGK
ncbi:EF-P 5-aminopentanol modification-associated protein YfmF [Vagococcus luciliae]|uniref:Antilisterial bacteriocin subtilosin biosynthesis protein AlbE n=1 Tax=Vagococcus luciliae TaxID=2920380 RepID=A0ABY5NWU7_9ENTE|nr:pitrilysin family protein [Vagococcus luciliae]UUV98114.1 Antilisterial bacteriocin subtilosin biosynthesis protein AlbE [Vagococcus luciliae]